MRDYLSRFVYWRRPTFTTAQGPVKAFSSSVRPKNSGTLMAFAGVRNIRTRIGEPRHRLSHSVGRQFAIAIDRRAEMWAWMRRADRSVERIGQFEDLPSGNVSPPSDQTAAPGRRDRTGLSCDRESPATGFTTELVLFTAVAGTRRIRFGSRVLLGGRHFSRVRP